MGLKNNFYVVMLPSSKILFLCMSCSSFWCKSVYPTARQGEGWNLMAHQNAFLLNGTPNNLCLDPFARIRCFCIMIMFSSNNLCSFPSFARFRSTIIGVPAGKRELRWLNPIYSFSSNHTRFINHHLALPLRKDEKLRWELAERIDATSSKDLGKYLLFL